MTLPGPGAAATAGDTVFRPGALLREHILNVLTWREGHELMDADQRCCGRHFTLFPCVISARAHHKLTQCQMSLLSNTPEKRTKHFSNWDLSEMAGERRDVSGLTATL